MVIDMAKTVTTTPKGLLTALSAFLIWGCFPLYFKALIEYDAIEIIVHRVVWTFVILLGITIITRRFRWMDQIKKAAQMAVFNLSCFYFNLNKLVGLCVGGDARSGT